jgi:hypothetical protein
MTDYKATTDQWAYQEHWAQEDGDAACLLELRDRVQSLEDDSWKQAESTSYCVDALVKRIEELEANTKQWRTDYLRLANTCAGMASDRLEFFGKLLPDGESDPEGEIIDYYNALAAQHAEKAAFHQDPSLAERVAMAITRDGEQARWDEARAAMLEIAKWLESRAGGTRACWLLEWEAQR